MKRFLWNPLTYDVEANIKLDDNNSKHLVAKSEKITEFENEREFKHIRKYLVDAIINSRNIKFGFDDVRESIENEVTKVL